MRVEQVGTRILARVVVATALAGAATGAEAQTACVVGANPGPCSVGAGTSVPGTVVTNADGATVTNAGDVAGDIQTVNIGSGVTNSGSAVNIYTSASGSGVTNSGTVGGGINTSGSSSAVNNSGTVSGQVVTIGSNSGVVNTGTVQGTVSTLGSNSGATNSGSIETGLQTLGTGSSISNTGTVGTYLITQGAGSTITNSGTVGSYIITSTANSKITNLGSVGEYILTIGSNSGVTNTGAVEQYVQTIGSNSAVTNDGSVGQYIITIGSNSGITNTGAVGQYVQTIGSNSSVTNIGSVGQYLQTIGSDSGVTNSGSVGQYVQTIGNDSAVVNSGSIAGYVRTSGVGSSVTNSGFVGGGITMIGSDPTLTLLAGSRIVGTVGLYGGGTKTLNVGNGLNAVLTFDTFAPTVVNSNGAPYVAVGTQVAVLDTTAFAQQGRMLADMTSGIFGTVYGRIGGTSGGNASTFSGMQLGADGIMQLGLGTGGGGVQNEPRVGRRDFGLWAQAFGGRRDTETQGATTGTEQRFAGGIAGIDGQLLPGVRIGAFGGGSEAEIKTATATQQIEADSWFGGAYASYQSKTWFASVMLTAGKSEHASTRSVANNLAANGLEFAKASYDGTFVSPEVALGTSIKVAGLVLEPSVRARYAAMSVDGYTEAGASDGLSVGGRDLSLWLGRAQVAMPMTGAMGTIAPRVGVEAWSSSSEQMTASLLGQSIAFAPGGRKDEVTGFIGLTATPSLGGGLSAFVDGEVHLGTDGISRTEGRAGLVLRF